MLRNRQNPLIAEFEEKFAHQVVNDDHEHRLWYITRDIMEKDGKTLSFRDYLPVDVSLYDRECLKKALRLELYSIDDVLKGRFAEEAAQR